MWEQNKKRTDYTKRYTYEMNSIIGLNVKIVMFTLSNTLRNQYCFLTSDLLLLFFCYDHENQKNKTKTNKRSKFIETQLLYSIQWILFLNDFLISFPALCTTDALLRYCLEWFFHILIPIFRRYIANLSCCNLHVF